jgi:hypothetical protein
MKTKAKRSLEVKPWHATRVLRGICDSPVARSLITLKSTASSNARLLDKIFPFGR